MGDWWGASFKRLTPAMGTDGIQRIGGVPIYTSDAIVRRSPALQQTPDTWGDKLRLNAATAGALALGQTGISQQIVNMAFTLALGAIAVAAAAAGMAPDPGRRGRFHRRPARARRGFPAAHRPGRGGLPRGSRRQVSYCSPVDSWECTSPTRPGKRPIKRRTVCGVRAISGTSTIA